MNVIILGGGPSGMYAGITAAKAGHKVTLLEKNEKLGKKLYLTGKGRCNFTNAGGRDAFFSNVMRNPRFLYSAWSVCDSETIITSMQELGVMTKTERGGRVFPKSDKSSDIIRALQKGLEQLNVEVWLNTRALGIESEAARVTGVRTQGSLLKADAVVLCTGGASYTSTGSTGDGYKFAKELGHTIITQRPSLVPLETQQTWPCSLAGLSLKNVSLSAFESNRLVYKELGEMLFTHFGVSGPLVLSASAKMGRDPKDFRLSIDLKPGLTKEQLNSRLLRDLDVSKQKPLEAALSGLLPKKLLLQVLELTNLNPKLSVSDFTAKERAALIDLLKDLPLQIRCTRPLDEAIITAGGISVKEVNPSTLESKLVRGLYFAGEILDVDALTGGYNLQIAWSTGRLAGMLKGS